MPYRRNLGLFTVSERLKWKNNLINLQNIVRNDVWDNENRIEIGKVVSSLNNDQLNAVRAKYNLAGNASVQDILNDKKRTMDLYCFWYFSSLHISSIKTYLGITNVRGIDAKKIAFIRVLMFNDDQLKSILVHSLWIKHAVFERNYKLVEVNDAQIRLFQKKVRRIGILLSNSVKKYVHYERPYRLKMHSKFQDKYIYLFMRYKGDEEVLSFPNNKSQSKYIYKFVILDPTLKTLSIVVHTDTERRVILKYVSTKIKLKIIYNYGDTKVTKEQVSKLFIPESIRIPVTSITYKNVQTLPDSPKIIIQGNPILNPVNNSIASLSPNLIDAGDIANINRFSILFESQPIKISVDKIKDELNLGYYRLRIPERGLTHDAKDRLIKNFESNFKIPINKYFLFGETNIDYKAIINSLLNQKHIDLGDKPNTYTSTLDQLYNVGLLQKPKKVNQRFCIKEGCSMAYRNTWKRGPCISCENELTISGTSFRIKINSEYVTRFILDYLASKDLKFTKSKRTFNKRKRDVVELYTPKGNVTIIPVRSTKIDTSLLDYLKDNEINAVLVPYPNTSETREIRAKNHGVASVSELIYTKLYDKANDPLKTEINNTVDSAIDRTVNNFNDALARFEAHRNYTYSFFEKDMYSMLHFILPTAQRLGDDLIGKRVSDGIAAIPLDEERRFCITWDCKLTDNVYLFREPYKKTVTYLEKLSKLPIVKNFGGLHTFIFISNNPSEERFKKFCKKLIKNYKWRGQLVLLNASHLVKLSKHFKVIRSNLLASPELHSKYYDKITKLFYKSGRKIYLVKDSDIANIVEGDYTLPRISIRRSDV